MIQIKKLFIFSLFILSVRANCQENLTLWHCQPAETWTAALPVGNGRLDAMVFCRPEEEWIRLKEATLWSGVPVKSNVHPETINYQANIIRAEAKLATAEIESEMDGNCTLRTGLLVIISGLNVVSKQTAQEYPTFFQQKKQMVFD